MDGRDHFPPKKSRQDLTRWVNQILQLNISKIDELGSGAVYCQLMDAIHGDVPMHRVIFDSSSESDWQTNFKILQAQFNKHKISKNFDSTALMRCKFQDNLEFSQWLSNYAYEQGVIQGYDPIARRRGGVGGSRASLAPDYSAPIGDGARARSASRSSTRAPTRVASSSSRQASRTSMPPPMQRTHHRTPSVTSRASSSMSVGRPPKGNLHSFVPPTLPGPSQEEIDDLTNIIEELQQSVDILTAERQLYYLKLVQIEVLVEENLDACYKNANNAAAERSTLDMTDPTVKLLRDIQSVLYASSEGFETPARPDDEPF